MRPSSTLELQSSLALGRGYASFRHLPERERWEICSLAKTGRLALEDRGVTMLEPYDDFVWCVCNELEI
ncbi:hypothetical protein PSCICO_47010 [Pseudomonas cichorii]|uniref:hypothetical protein n=1 Tax=Pseudomonas cichorii TaxID=36746 RepID=UPI001F87D978|nr:hypothetical protein [Pseudomonas cichorii]GFM89302.1 hypothetical protein PSCICO_47010 [Pseudomonas cichorii]